MKRDSILHVWSLRKKCPHTEFFLVRIFLYSNWIQENTDQKKLRIWILFKQLTGFWMRLLFSCPKYITTQTAHFTADIIFPKPLGNVINFSKTDQFQMSNVLLKFVFTRTKMIFLWIWNILNFLWLSCTLRICNQLNLRQKKCWNFPYYSRFEIWTQK